MMKRIKLLIAAGIVFVCCMLQQTKIYASASDGEDYITISVEAEDDSGNLKYALDSDDPSAFTSANEFTVPAGTSHTIYVKDAAGNITSQQYEPQQSQSTSYEYYYSDSDDEEDTRQINIDLELGQKSDIEESALTSDTEGKSGTASVTNRTITDGTVDSERVFYTFTTKEGAELYLVVDQGSGSDNVYLLDTVSLTDLRVLADGYDSSSGSSSSVANNDKSEENLLSILADEGNTDDPLENIETSKSKKSTYGNPLLILLLVGIGAGGYYYLKIYRNKKDEAMDAMDAMDMDEFEAEEDDEEEAEFDYDEAEKEQYLENLLNEDDDFLDENPDNYAVSEMQESDSLDEDVEEDYDVDIF